MSTRARTPAQRAARYAAKVAKRVQSANAPLSLNLELELTLAWLAGHQETKLAPPVPGAAAGGPL